MTADDLARRSHIALSADILGAAMNVLNVLRPGLDEKLYENALVIELTKRGRRINQQKAFPVHYDGQLIGTLIPDLIVDDLVMLRNFKSAKLEWKRIVR